jgi:glycosyltransferase involved in cell wall biosynthesis
MFDRIDPVLDRGRHEMPELVAGRIVMGLLFFPRGGSAQVSRYLAMALGDRGWTLALVAGSLGSPGESTHAPTFFEGIELHHLDYTAAVDTFDSGQRGIDAPIPMHPSYEDRVDAPDVVLAAVDPALEPHLAAVWEAPLAAAGADHADVFHLHHLTPQHDAARRRWPHVPIVAHLHGTEIKLVEAIDARAALAARLGTTLAAMPVALAEGAIDRRGLDEGSQKLLESTRWAHWRHGAHWAARLRAQAQAADHLIVVSPPDRATAIATLGVAPDHVTDVPNGVEIDRFRPRPMSSGARRARFRRWLVEDPQGWDASGEPGSVRYRDADLDRLLGADDDATVLVYVGRFTEAKRVPLLVRAFAIAQRRAARPASLLIWGGHPGEVEGEHPVTVADEMGADNIFFAGWRGHDDLPDGLAACDALVMPSVNDSYPQTPLEAMAVGLPVLATLSGGFPSMVNLDLTAPTGWLVAPDDLDALVAALVAVIDDPVEVRRRGAAALAHARAELSWAGRVAGFEHAYAAATERHAGR